MATKKRGRPTKYKPRYCEEILELARQGKGIAHYAAHCNTVRETIYAWGRDYPAFSDTLKRADELRELWWVDQALRQASGGAGNANITKWMMACNFGYKEPKDTPTVVVGTNADGKVEISFADAKPT